MIGVFQQLLLYEIDAVFLRGDSGHGFEVSMQVALVEKAALQGCIADISSFAQIFPGQVYPAVHAIGVGGDACSCLEFSQQGVGIGVEQCGKGVEGEIFMEILLQDLFEPVDIAAQGGARVLRMAAFRKNSTHQVNEHLLLFLQMDVRREQLLHGVAVALIELFILETDSGERTEIVDIPERLLHREAPVHIKIEHEVTATVFVERVAGVEGFGIDQGQGAGTKSGNVSSNRILDQTLINSTDTDGGVEMRLEYRFAAL